jgi:hypothetical protein
MESYRDSLAFWATILGTILGVLGLIRSYTWLTTIGVLLFLTAIGALLYAGHERRKVRLAGIQIDGRSIDSLNAASVHRRLNKNLVIQDARQVATIDGEDLTVASECAGYCRNDREASVEFSIDSDTNIPFDQLRCVGYDLRHDPEKKYPIKPILVGPDGLSKKIAVPFLAPVHAQEPFRMLLTCELPGCMKNGVEYFTSTLSFTQETVRRHHVRLIFIGAQPESVRVYECEDSGAVRLLRELCRARDTKGRSEYEDIAEDVPARSARIYIFRRGHDAA